MCAQSWMCTGWRSHVLHEGQGDTCQYCLFVLQAPCPGTYCQGLDEKEMNRGMSAYVVRFSWVRLYAALLGTVQLLRGPKPVSTVLDM